MASIELMISKNLAALNDDAVELVPANGKKVRIRTFNSGGEDSALVSIRLYWKYGQAGEVLIWSLSPGDQIPFVYDVPDGDVDGVNKIGLVIDNENVSSRYVAGYALVEVND
jgi:hypothetical protein